jgi:hypothetical protein
VGIHDGYIPRMSEWKLPWHGGCRCGRVRIRITQPPLIAMACHCTGCQTMSASAFSLSLAIPIAGFTVVQGEPVLGGLRAAIPHNMCPECMSWIFTGPFTEAGFVNVRPTMLDDHAWFAPYIESYTREKLAWATTGAVHSFERFPDPSRYPALIAEYAVRGARP